MTFSSSYSYRTADVEKLLKDADAFDYFFDNLQSVKAMRASRDQLRDQNESLAKDNLSKEKQVARLIPPFNHLPAPIEGHCFNLDTQQSTGPRSGKRYCCTGSAAAREETRAGPEAHPPATDTSRMRPFIHRVVVVVCANERAERAERCMVG